MPHITYPLPTGRPLIDLVVGISEARKSAYKKEGKDIPAPISIRGLIDTGATNTCIDKRVLATLGITPIGSTFSFTASCGVTPVSANQYDISILIPLQKPIAGVARVFGDILVTEFDLSIQGIQALIGCDILRNGVFIFCDDHFILSL